MPAAEASCDIYSVEDAEHARSGRPTTFLRSMAPFVQGVAGRSGGGGGGSPTAVRVRGEGSDDEECVLYILRKVLLEGAEGQRQGIMPLWGRP